MSSTPLRLCATPRCSNRVTQGHCAQHRRQKDLARGTRHERGYDRAWERLTQANLAAQPWCVGYPKGYHKVRTLAQVTDHIVSIRERPDLRLVPSNLQSLCNDCNRRKGIALEGGFGR